MPVFPTTLYWILAILLSRHGVHLFTANVWDNTFRKDKLKMIDLGKELLIDAKVKQRQIHEIRETHNSEVAYDVGLIIGKIREKYKRMTDIYREAFDRKTNRTKLTPPGVKNFKLLHWIMSMEMVRAIEVDIDKLVHALESVPESILKSQFKPPIDKIKEIMGPSSVPPIANVSSAEETQPPIFRTGCTEKPKFNNEAELKQYYKEQYLAKSGHDANWTLDEYYGVI